MKCFRYLCITLLFFAIQINFAKMVMGSLTQEIESTTSIERKRLRYACEEKSYTSGGTTFTFPSNLFTTSPLIQVSVEPTSSHSDSKTFVAEIASRSSSSTVIKVYELEEDDFREADDDDVYVHLFAIGH